MRLSQEVERILNYYNSENPGVKSSLARILMHGKLGGTGKLIILPVDQGFEHGPARSFAINQAAYDPQYHIEMAIDAGLSAYAAPLGMIEVIADKYAGTIPLILKINSSNSLAPKNSAPYQAITSNVRDALRLGCLAVGFTIYPGSDCAAQMISEAKEIIKEAKSYGLATIIWSYPRGADLSKSGETAIDVCAYAAHIAALIGANIIKVKLPSEYIEQNESKMIYQKENINISDLKSRIIHVMEACFNNKRIVLFSGGATKSLSDLYKEVSDINQAGGHGSIIGRNAFQRPREEALIMLEKLIEIYKN